MLYVLFGDVELIAYLTASAVAMFGRSISRAGCSCRIQGVRGRVGIAALRIANVARRGRRQCQVVAFGIGLMVLLLRPPCARSS